MTETPDDDHTVNRLGPVLRGAVFSIRWERVWRILWAPLAVFTLFIGIALTDVLPMLPDVVHALVLCFLAAILGFSCSGFKRAFAPIDAEQAARRVEDESGLHHRPLTALFDHPTQSKLSPEAEVLWHAHLKRAEKDTEKLTVPLPRPRVGRRDIRGLRFISVIVLFIGILMGGSEPFDRIARAVAPTGGEYQAQAFQIDLWLTPPRYTGLAATTFSQTGMPAQTDTDARDAALMGSLIVPVGSQLLVQITDAEHAPVLAIGSNDVAFEQLGDEQSASYKLETQVDADFVGAEKMSIKIGGVRVAEWMVQVAPDAAPTVEYERAPTRRRDTQLDIAYLAGDDYGVRQIEMLIVRPNGRAVPGGEAEIRVELPLSRDRRNIQTSSARDFSAHPWAGLPVRVQLIATDTANQTAETETVEVVLPERIFNHPVARSLADVRKQINDPTPDVIKAGAAQLQELSLYPMRFFDDLVAFLSIRVAHSRLVYAKGDAEIASVQQLLWETALRIEDGEFALAEADLMRLQDEAMQALRDGKLGEELDQVMRQLQEAMDRYMQALAERLEEMGLDQLPPMANLPEMQTQDIQDMMDRIQEMAETGNRDAAEQMLAEMQQMMEQLRDGLQMQQTNPAMANARKMMDDLRSLSEDQQQLLDRTFEESQNERSGAFQRPRLGQRQPGQQQQGQQPGQQPGQQQGQNGQPGQQPGQQQGQGPSAADQEALRKRLGELMMQMDEAFGQIPENMGQAEQQMEQAGNNMGKGEFGDAANNQAQALEELRNATNQMAEAMAQQFGAQLGLGNGQPQRSGNQQGFDPFGRRNSNENGQGSAAEDADVQLPDRMEILRAREILEELRKRSGERSRPKIELDYIDRLLDIF